MGDKATTERHMWHESLESEFWLRATKGWTSGTSEFFPACGKSNWVEGLCYNLVCHSEDLFFFFGPPIYFGARPFWDFQDQFFQFLRMLPRGMSERGSWDIPEPILSLHAIDCKYLGTTTERHTFVPVISPCDQWHKTANRPNSCIWQWEMTLENLAAKGTWDPGRERQRFLGATG